MIAFSRNGLDLFLLENFLRGRRNGVFVDAGARPSEEFSHTRFLEESLGWRGLCLTADAQTHARVAAERKCTCEQAEPRKLGTLLQKYSVTHVDFCSLDAGGAELSVLSELDLNRVRIGLIAIRNATNDARVAQLMADHHYQLVTRFDLGFSLFKHRDVRRLARTSVICAVWHRDADRQRLLEAHAANLANQTVAVEPVYIFDGSDQPPASVPGHKVVAHENLSIYQAWNVGLAMVSTPFVMNLNLDDRLAPNAVELLENTLLNEDAALVGGEWNICYSQEDTDAVQPVYPAAQLPFATTWPPPAGTRTRLGSGTGDRNTFGPATLWRLDAHIGAPRYPWRFVDGSQIKVIADLCWWKILIEHLQKKVVRIPQVIGNYHSHPGEQAEFRGGPSNELGLMQSVGVSLF
jgi:hypothetical protein